MAGLGKGGNNDASLPFVNLLGSSLKVRESANYNQSGEKYAEAGSGSRSAVVFIIMLSRQFPQRWSSPRRRRQETPTVGASGMAYIQPLKQRKARCNLR